MMIKEQHKICDECDTVAHCTKHGCVPKVSAKDAMKLANEFNRYFTSKNGVDVPARISVPRDEWRELFAALAEQPPVQQEPVAFLANGTRFKISYDSRQSGGQIHGIPPELGGRWVAFVAADDDCHLKLTSPPARKPLTDEEIVAKALHLSGLGTSPDVIQFARAIEAAHGIKGEA